MPGLSAITGDSGLSGIMADNYVTKVLSLDPIAYWPLWETSGTTARCLVNPAQNGTYKRNVTVMTTAAGIGDGYTAPLFTPNNDCVNVYSATLAGGWSPTEGSMSIWLKVANAGILTDGINHFPFHIGADAGANFVRFLKTTTNNLFQGTYVAGGTVDTRNVTIANVVWHLLTITWSSSGNAIIVYLDGVQQGAVMVGLGAWVGALAATLCVIGAQTTTPGLSWAGWLAHAAIWDRAITQPEVTALATV